jgi:hypothetical protein
MMEFNKIREIPPLLSTGRPKIYEIVTRKIVARKAGGSVPVYHYFHTYTEALLFLQKLKTGGPE